MSSLFGLLHSEEPSVKALPELTVDLSESLVVSSGMASPAVSVLVVLLTALLLTMAVSNVWFPVSIQWRTRPVLMCTSGWHLAKGLLQG